MPDFNFKAGSFPIADVINAAQRKAQLEEQAKQDDNTNLVQGLNAIGQVGQGLVAKRMKVAQALALGKQFGMDDAISRDMDPAQILQIQAINKGMVDSDFLKNAMAALAGRGVPSATTPGGATPASASTPAHSQSPSNGVVLASDSTATPIAPTPTTPVQTAPILNPVPIQAPPSKPRMVNPATAKIALDVAKANALEPVMSKEAALTAGNVHKGTKIVEPTGTNTDKKEQDAYWRDAVRGLQSIRGDTAMKDIETQRNAATQAFNRLKDIAMTGKSPNPIDYIDILGQVYKARTGTAPTQEVLKEAKQNTAQGQFGKYWTYFTGDQMPGTSKEIASSLKDMVSHMGLQADELHDGYMQVHGSQVFNPNMSEDNVKKLSKLSRGKSFADSTGVKAEDFDVHLQAIKWAQANPNDPRSAPILQKALQEKSATSGGSIGL